VRYATAGNHTMKGVVLCGNDTQRDVKHYVTLKGKHISACNERHIFPGRNVTSVFTILVSKVKVVKCTLVQALRLCTGRTVHRGSRGIALLYRH
jgi:hypothetical protein